MRMMAITAVLLAVLFPATGHAARGKAKRTGQTTSFGAAGDTTAGLTSSYVDNGLGFVKDQRTGLMWEKKSDDGSIHDKDDAYRWSQGDPWDATGSAFTTFLAALNTAPCFAGYCDWRFPTVNELETIRDLEPSGAAISPEFDTGCTPGCSVTTCSCTAAYFTWTASTSPRFPNSAWGVDFGDGTVYGGSKSDLYFVRAVRSSN